nr:hypothetical protein KV8917_910001 [Klebsiella variicola]
MNAAFALTVKVANSAAPKNNLVINPLLKSNFYRLHDNKKFFFHTGGKMPPGRKNILFRLIQ